MLLYPVDTICRSTRSLLFAAKPRLRDKLDWIVRSQAADGAMFHMLVVNSIGQRLATNSFCCFRQLRPPFPENQTAYNLRRHETWIRA